VSAHKKPKNKTNIYIYKAVRETKVKKRLLNAFGVMDGSRNGLKSCYHDSAQIGGTYFPRDVFEITSSPTPFTHTYIHYSFEAKSQYICIYIKLIVRVVFQDTDYVQYISFTTHLPMCSNVGDFFRFPGKPLLAQRQQE